MYRMRTRCRVAAPVVGSAAGPAAPALGASARAEERVSTAIAFILSRSGLSPGIAPVAHDTQGAPACVRSPAMEVRDGYAPLARLVADRAVERAPLIVGIAGGVAVGKSTAAAAVSELFPPGRVEVVATDGFLHPNAWLDAHGLVHRKGFPESYDRDGVEAFLDAVRRGEPQLDVPVYDHVTYDVLAARRRISAPSVLVLEGVNALQ